MTIHPLHGPLRRNPANPRYFTDDTGQAIYLTGSHTWANLVDIKGEGTPDFDYSAWLNFMQSNQHNFMRMWTWDHTFGGPWTEDKVWFDPMPFERPGPELANDRRPKFDLSRYNDAYFQRLRERVRQAGERGIYVAVMLFEGWCLKWSYPASDAWPYHPYHANNNVNGVNGDTDGDGRGDVYSLESPEVLRFQEAYVRKVIDTLNDLDNVLWEICNEVENAERAFKWSFHMVDFVRAYERTLPKQHPVGMTAEGGNQHNPVLFASNADWISPGRGPNNEYQFDPPEGDGRKVILTDTDHLWGHGGTPQWVWKSMMRGLNPIFMDPWMPVPGKTRAGYASDIVNTRDYPEWETIRIAMGRTRKLLERVNLNAMEPDSRRSTTGFCLADPHHAYIAYAPDDIRLTLDLWETAGDYAVEWINTRTGQSVDMADVHGGRRITFTSPVGQDAVLLLKRR